MMEVHQLITTSWKLTEVKDGKRSTRVAGSNSYARISFQEHSTKFVWLALLKAECQTIQRYVIFALNLWLLANVLLPSLMENQKPILYT
jgi:hypothetical protein